MTPNYQTFGYGTGTPTGASGGTWEQKLTGTPTTYAVNGYGYDATGSGFALMPKITHVTGQNTPPTNYVDYLTGQSDVNNPITQPLSDGTTTDDSATGTLAQAYEKAAKSAEETRDQSKEQARIDYESAILDAERRYQQAMGAHGQTAESLAASGLAESGYAKYLRDRAYGKKVDEIVAAKGTRAANERNADNIYSQAIQQIEMNKEQQQEANSALYAGTVDYAKDITDAFTKGTISPTQYETYKKDIAEDAMTQINRGTLYGTGTARKTSAEATKLLDSLKPYLSEDQYNAAKELRDNQYVVYSNYKTGNALGTVRSEFEDTADGEEFDIWHAPADETFSVIKNATPVTDADVLDAVYAMKFDTSAAEDKKGTLPVFGVNDNIYLYVDGKVYLIDDGDEYQDLYNFVFNNKDSNVITKTVY